MQTVQGELAPLYLSTDNINWKVLVCLETYDLGMQTTVNQVETACGIATGLGAIKFTPKGSAVMEASPSSSQVTMHDMIQWQQSKTLLFFKTEYPGSGGNYGQNVALGGNVYVTEVTPTFQTGQVIKFAWGLTGTGTVIDIPF